ncbi:MAG: hypothetical protein AMR96_05385 [Candidatus Adiutrix intracellularis]|jgi:pyruvate formate lyase activating enzyme|nr:MAG: hypothetical protein AMR96_05385 [Candidatus Adiutrix intracellularis]MDR2826732.1 anaerobic ribonucleoside-triphosphate reductase activating protein [Candidatus Adiutrix intracellularis]
MLKNSTLDYPGLVSAVIFTQGCNFTCPYCHNPHLVSFFGTPLTEEAVLFFLRKRRPFLDGVVISGGEPTIQPDLAEFCKQLQSLGYQVKLDTNGSDPEVVRNLIERKLINYLALDLKSDPGNYPLEIAPSRGEAILTTIALLKRAAIPYEFRTTCAAPFVNRETIERIAQAARGSASLFLQPCHLERDLLDSVFMHTQPRLSIAEIEEFCLVAGSYLPTVVRR